MLYFIFMNIEKQKPKSVMLKYKCDIKKYLKAKIKNKNKTKK